MTILGWIICIIVCIGALIVGACIIWGCELEKLGITITSILTALLIIGTFVLGFWICNNTEAGKRAMIDQKSNLSGGLERTVTVYTADGEVLATYEGKIDIDANDGGYIKFDYNGNRYIYYNCFVESIAKIDNE